VAGLFTCECGFAYVRKGIDHEGTNIYEYDRVKHYGAVWEQKLGELWNNPSVSLTEIATRLGVARYTIYSKAAALRASSTRLLDKSGPHTSRGRCHQEKRDEKRQRLLSALEANPEQTRKELQKAHGFLLNWLRRYDPAWLEEHLPTRAVRSYESSTINWVELDQQLAAAVTLGADRLKSAERPVRVYAATLAREIEYEKFREQQLVKLPLTRAVLQQVTDTRDSFALRRITWAATFFQQQGKYPTRSQLVYKAGCTLYKDNALIKEAIDEALQWLRTAIGET
jgi:hypothetical protein